MKAVHLWFLWLQVVAPTEAPLPVVTLGIYATEATCEAARRSWANPYPKVHVQLGCQLGGPPP